jgi:hypothetical protein
MTDDRMALVDLLQKSGDGDFLRSVAEAVLQIPMEADVEGLIGAERHERTGDRLNYRNGYRERSLDTRLGSLQPRIPKLRQGSYFPPFLEPRKTAEKALVTVIQEAWIGGVSTRRVDELVQAMGLAGISKSQVSKGNYQVDVAPCYVNLIIPAVFAAGQPFDIIDPAGGAVVATNASVADFATKMPRVIRDSNNPFGRRDRLGTTHHEAGTLRMGDSAGNSVTDANCRMHGIKNVYVASPALFPTTGSPNPMLTGIALARRLGDHLLPPPPVINAADPAEAGFRYLFQGTETSPVFATNWTKVGGGGFIRVGRALIMRPGSDGIGLLFYTGERFDNFTLRLDFCLPHPRGNANDNSGVFVRFRDPRKPVLPGTPGPNVPGNLASVAVDTGYEIQIDEEARGDTRIGEGDGFPFNRTGAIYKIPIGNGAGQQNYANQQRLVAGVWHRYEITAMDRTYKVLLDGQPATEFTANAADPNEKFRGRKKSEDSDSGFIGLQIHTGTVLFANVRVKP